MARDHRHQLRFACSARYQAPRRVTVAWQSCLRPHAPTRGKGPHTCSVGFGLRFCGLRSVDAPPVSFPFFPLPIYRMAPASFVGWAACSGTLVWPRAALRLHAVHSVRAPGPPTAGLARRRTRLTRAAFSGQALHLLLLGAEGDIDLQVRLEPWRLHTVVFLYTVYTVYTVAPRVCVVCVHAKNIKSEMPV